MKVATLVRILMIVGVMAIAKDLFVPVDAKELRDLGFWAIGIWTIYTALDELYKWAKNEILKWASHKRKRRRKDEEEVPPVPRPVVG